MSDDTFTQNDGNVRGSRWLWAEPHEPGTDPITLRDAIAEFAERFGIKPEAWQLEAIERALTTVPAVPSRPAECVRWDCEVVGDHTHQDAPGWVPAFDRTLILDPTPVLVWHPCPAHGERQCADCSRPGGATGVTCDQCSTYGEPGHGFHWDTCANRDRTPMHVHQDSGTVTP